MDQQEYVSTGIKGLDKAIDSLRPGDTVTWQMENVGDYMYVATQFVVDEALTGRPMVYLRFGDHEELIPTGEIAPVDSTAFDFREGKPVTPEFDHNFVLRGAPGEPALELYEPGTGILLRVYTDQPGLQLYSGRPDCGVVLETQNFPDAPNHPNFPDAVLGPGENYVQNTIYRFEIL